MTGERLSWYRVASHLRLPVTELKDRISFREFLDWLLFLVTEEKKETKQDFYLAQIAAEIRRGQVKNPKTVKIKDFFVTMEVIGPKEAAAQKSKAAWVGHLKVDLGKK